MKFDWYSATVDRGPDEVCGELLRGHPFGRLEPCRGMYSYSRGALVRSGGDVVARAFWGGVNGHNSTHIQATGDRSPEVAARVREVWPAHRLSRADVCEDYDSPGAWLSLSRLAKRLARQSGVLLEPRGDWFAGGVQGRTLYLGGRQSAVRVRIYEKGKQLRRENRDWVRVEAEVRPSGTGKTECARASPAQLFSAAAWSAELAQRLGVPQFERVRVRDPWRQSDDDRALAFMVHQYGKLLDRTSERVGGWSTLGESLGLEFAEQQRRNRKGTGA